MSLSSMFKYAAKREFYNALKAREKQKAQQTYQKKLEIQKRSDDILKRKRISQYNFENIINNFEDLLKQRKLDQKIIELYNTAINESEIIQNTWTAEEKRRIYNHKQWSIDISPKDCLDMINELGLTESQYIGDKHLEPNASTTLAFLVENTNVYKQIKAKCIGSKHLQVYASDIVKKYEVVILLSIDFR